ncbi:MAG: VCBS repeat-containing protein [Microthrixaceae bacterium]|nr:VCBS repeat-containing protein [Microthrixaceae bacterium]
MAALIVLAMVVPTGCSSRTDDGHKQSEASTTSLSSSENESGHDYAAGCPESSSPEVVSTVAIGEVVWSIPCYLNEYSSLISRDLNGDSVDDLIINASVDGPLKGQPSLVALNGVDGTVLWASTEAIIAVTVPLGVDLNGDGIDDLVVGGRGLPESDRPLVAVSGKDGSTIWRIEATKTSWQNVYTPQSLGDVDGDGVPDIVIATGGDHIREAMEPPKVAGRIVAMSGSDGHVLGVLSAPDGQEIYSSPVLIPDGRGDTVVFGTGGEYFSGSLWRIPVRSLLKQQKKDFVKLIPGGRSSFIAPVSIGDVEGNGGLTGAVVQTDGTVHLIDLNSAGSSDVKWTSHEIRDEVEHRAGNRVLTGLAAPALGQLDDDAALEIVVQYVVTEKSARDVGQFQDTGMILAVYDGLTGEVEQIHEDNKVDTFLSPLVVERSGEVQVLCACVPSASGDRAELAFWRPLTGVFEPLGLRPSRAATPSFAGSAEAGFRLNVGLNAAPGSTEGGSTMPYVAAVALDIDDATWGGYMGTAHTGWIRQP